MGTCESRYNAVVIHPKSLFNNELYSDTSFLACSGSNQYTCIMYCLCEQKFTCCLDFVIWLLFLAWFVAWIVAL